MRVVLGLGNPGPEYVDTRHNVGWWLVDLLARRWGAGPFRAEGRAVAGGAAEATAARVDGEEVWLVKPLTYMNRSGLVARSLSEGWPGDPEREALDVTRHLLVVVDDAALPTGRARFRAWGSAGGHNGLLSIEAALGTQEYARLRIGVGSPPPGADLSEWVLSPFASSEEEEAVLGLLPALAEGVEVWVREGIEPAMSRYNR